ncbi:hypothetical protein NECAME_12792 [Necator americanus]|uniref:Uncharacterized protein n=1 Tax=Necator americanus TaxID=51031 RepID=W2SYQ1_NECAM|nr:hypothetical protein NECAME_12792 [Necator americanus]ETN74703.1 hypothetical protein NECAME_12792 [Necator americanus]
MRKNQSIMYQLVKVTLSLIRPLLHEVHCLQWKRKNRHLMHQRLQLRQQPHHETLEIFLEEVVF